MSFPNTQSSSATQLNQSENIPIYTTGKTAPSADITLQSNGASPIANASQFRADGRFAGIDGKGYSTVIIDTGIDLNHPFFGPDRDKNGVADRIVYQYDFANDDANASDRDGHGSHIASVAASSDSRYPGIAPGANIISLKVFEDLGGGSFGDVEAALRWVDANAEKYNIASVNLAFTDGQNYNKPVQQYGIDDEIADLANKKVAVVAAAGNEFAKYNSAQGVGYPAADPNVISVGAVYGESVGKATYANGAEAYSSVPNRIAPFSQRHKSLTTVFAPGAPITGADDTGGTLSRQGTSQAVPHVAGAIVLAQQLAEKELGRRLSVPELENLLASSGKTIVDGDDEKDNVKNTGLSYKSLDMLNLGEAIANMKGQRNSPVPTSVARGDTSTANESLTAASTELDSNDFLTGSNKNSVAAEAMNWLTSLSEEESTNIFAELTDNPTIGGASERAIFPTTDNFSELTVPHLVI
jgi:hypothetical protein